MSTLNEQAFKRLKAVNKDLKNKKHFTFVFFGDTRGEEDDPSHPIDTVILKEILDQIYKLPETPAFVLCGGDLAVFGTVANLKKFRTIIEEHPLIKEKKVPFFSLPGNHEVNQSIEKRQFSLKNFRQIIGKPRFVIPIPKFKFQVLAMNNVTSLKPDHRVNYGFSQKDIDFMNKKVDKNRNGRTVIAFHTPPNFDCWAIHSMDEVHTRQFVNQVVNKHPKQIPLILTSHIHAYSEIRRNDTTYVLAGGGGAPLESKEEFPCTDPVFNFVEFKVTQDSIKGTVFKNRWVHSKIKM